MYDRNIHGRELTFGFYPDVYQNNLLLIDIETRSLWSQLERRAVEGKQQGTAWPVVPSMQTTWSHWRRLHPETLVVLPAAGRHKTYTYARPRHGTSVGAATPGTGQTAAEAEQPHGLGPLELVLGVELNGRAKAYLFSRLAVRQAPLEDQIGDQAVVVHFHAASPAAWATDAAGNLLPGMTTYWRAWKRFHPETAVYDGR